MSYSLQDIEKAFKCSAKGANEIEPIGMTQARVISHLEGNCPCDADRCRSCGGRPRNGIPRHLAGCKMGGDA